MKIILVYLGDVLNCPPAMSLVNSFNKLDKEISFICYPSNDKQFVEFEKSNTNVKFIKLGESNTKSNVVKKIILFLKYRILLKRLIDQEYDNDSIIWVLSNGTLKYFGKYLYKYNYLLHLLELTEKLYLIESKHMLPLSIEYARKALAIVECEYNRAHITKAWWNLSELPFVLQNKPFNHKTFNKDEGISSSRSISNLFETELKDKKIVLYQGNVSKERPISTFIDAVSELGDDYAFVAMTNGDVDYKGKSTNFYQIPFVAPPKHLEITSRAFIGILSYTPIKNSYSILNTLYCAPNKIWEYSMFSIPMIGNDLPALKNHFLEFGDGVCLSSISIEEIKRAILTIDKNYTDYSKNSKLFFDSYNYENEVKAILDSCEARKKRKF